MESKEADGLHISWTVPLDNSNLDAPSNIAFLPAVLPSLPDSCPQIFFIHSGQGNTQPQRQTEKCQSGHAVPVQCHQHNVHNYCDIFGQETVASNPKSPERNSV